MDILLALDLVFTRTIQVLILIVVLLMLVRFIMNLADVNPFSRLAMNVRRLTDPMVNPIKRGLLAFGGEPKLAPLIVILIAILLGYFTISLIDAILFTIRGALVAISYGSIVGVVGYILYGLLQIYSLLILIRIVFSWGSVSYSNPIMKFLVRATDPLLVPLRRVIPPLGMFDISPIVAFLIIWLFQQAIAATLLRGLAG
jgi:YggT family protein